MENSYLENKIVLKYCKDYYRIINEEFSENDFMTDKIINIFQEYIFGIDVKDKLQLKTVSVLNCALARYIDDWEFKSILTNILLSFKVPKNENNILSLIVNKIISEYKKYINGYTRNLYIPRWI